MDRQTQLKRLVWLYTTEDKARKLYAWDEAQKLDHPHLYPGISGELRSIMTGQAASLASESLTPPKPR